MPLPGLSANTKLDIFGKNDHILSIESLSAKDDFYVDMVGTEEEDLEGESVESVDAEEDDFQEMDIVDDDWLVPNNN